MSCAHTATFLPSQGDTVGCSHDVGLDSMTVDITERGALEIRDIGVLVQLLNSLSQECKCPASQAPFPKEKPHSPNYIYLASQLDNMGVLEARCERGRCRPRKGVDALCVVEISKGKLDISLC